MLTDVVDLVADTPQVDPALLVVEGAEALAEQVGWPGTPQIAVSGGDDLALLLAAAASVAGSAAAVVVADAPDLPSVLLGKLFSALAGPPQRSLAVCPAEGGGLVAAATTVPGPPQWLVGAAVRCDQPDALDRIRLVAPAGELSVGPGWHRVRRRADTALLDPGLEGWEATRLLLASE